MSESAFKSANTRVGSTRYSEVCDKTEDSSPAGDTETITSTLDYVSADSGGGEEMVVSHCDSHGFSQVPVCEGKIEQKMEHVSEDGELNTDSVSCVESTVIGQDVLPTHYLHMHSEAAGVDVPSSKDAGVRAELLDGISDQSLSGTSQTDRHIKNISMKDLSELLAHDTMSVVIISGDGHHDDWLQHTDIIVEKKTENEHSPSDPETHMQASEVQYITVTAPGVCESSDSVSYTLKVEPGDVSVAQIKQEPGDWEMREGRKRSGESSPPCSESKVQKLAMPANYNQTDGGSLVSLSAIKREVSDNQSTGTQLTSVDAQEFQFVPNTSAIGGTSTSPTAPPNSMSDSQYPVVHVYTTSTTSLVTEGSIVVNDAQHSSIKLVKVSSHEQSHEMRSSIDASVPCSLSENVAYRKNHVPGDIVEDSTKAAADNSTLLKESSSVSCCQQDRSEGKASSSSSGLSTVDSGMVYRCAECDYASSNKHYYKQHVDLVHKTERPFKCPFCDYAGKRGHALREHLVIHSVEDPFTCSQCNATFRKKAHLTTHTKLHSATLSSSSDFTKIGVGPGTTGRVVVLSSLPSGAPVRLASVRKTGAAMGVRAPTPVLQSVNLKESGQKVKPGSGAAALWCALCKQAMVDAAAFQAHLQSVHGTDRLFVCERCDVVAADRSAILAHLPTHLAPSTTATTLSPAKIIFTSTPANLPVGCRPLYSCTDCDFTTPSMNLLVAHAKTHAITVTTTTLAPMATSSVTAPLPLALMKESQQMQVGPHPAAPSKVICSECGLVADDVEVMKAHMWTHISKNSEVKDKAGFINTVTQLQHLTPGVGGNSVMRVIQSSAPELTGVNTLPQNAAFRCTECSYTSRDASLFVKHMLVHKTRQKPVVVSKTQQTSLGSTQSQTQVGVAGSNATITVSSSSTTKQNHAYKVRPVTTENTCKNTENTPFVHDACTGRFRCTICGYTCEYQRTIKAHIWKHSGHHQVDYPIFQNGPLSVYEDSVPASVKTTVHDSVHTDHGRVANSLPSSPGLKIVPVTSAPKLSIVPVASSVQQPAADTPGKHIIVHVKSGVADARSLLGASAERKGVQLGSSAEKKGAQFEETTKGSKQGNLHEGEGRSSWRLEAMTHVETTVKGSVSAVTSKTCEVQTVVKQEAATDVKKDKKRTPLVKIDLKLDDGPQGVHPTSHQFLGKQEAQLGRAAKGSNPKSVSKSEERHLGGKQSVTINAKSDDRQASQVKSDLQLDSGSADCSTVKNASKAQQSLPQASVCVSPRSGKIISSSVVFGITTEVTSVPLNSMSDVGQIASEASTNFYKLATCDMSAADISTAHGEEKETEMSIVGQGENSGVNLPVKQEQTSIICRNSDGDTQSADDASTAQPVNESVAHKTSLSTDESEIVAEKQVRSVQERSVSIESMETESITSALPAPNVVVEAVLSIPVSSAFTGLRSQNTSPRILHSQASSPVAIGNQSSVSQEEPACEPAEGKELSKKAVKRPLGSEDFETQSPQKIAKSVSQNQPETMHNDDSAGSNTEVTDSESAVTLLSLLKRGPNFNPACPQGAFASFNPLVCAATGGIYSISGCMHNPDSEPDIIANRSPDRPPTVDSDSDTKGTSTSLGDQASEDTASEVESMVSGKSRGGSGGICSSLLAVIEQLRERSRSESDAEDRASQPQPKKRPSRRRGRRESQEEALSPEDGENVEQLEGEATMTYRCKLCHYTSTRTPLIRLHMRTHRQKDPFECSLCPMVAESSEELQEHMIQHCKVRTYPCKFCPQAFNHKSTLRAHMRAHNDTEPFLCDLCDFETASPLEYRAHMQKHAGQGAAGMTLLKCPHCPALVTSHQDLQCHLSASCSTQLQGQFADEEQKHSQEANSAQDGGPKERLLCSQCDFYTHDLSGLREHASRVHGVGSSFASSNTDGPLRCALCEFTAVSSRSLKSHMKRHANDQRYVQQPLEQYKCSLCGYVCHHLPSLKSHMWRHASDQNYSYQFTNDVINAAIDYDTRVDLTPQSSDRSLPNSSGSSALPLLMSSSAEKPVLLDRFLSAERRMMEGQLSKMAAKGTDPLCWVTFRCCQCGFETINKAKLNLHMRTHADIINRTLKIKVDSAPQLADHDPDKVKLEVVYEPV